MDLTGEAIRLAAALCLIIVGIMAVRQMIWQTRGSSNIVAEPQLRQSQNPVFLFEGYQLIDASPAAAALIASQSDAPNEFEALIQVLSRQFPDLRSRVSSLRAGATTMLTANNDRGLHLQLHDGHGVTRISLVDPDKGFALQRYEALERDAQTEELNLLRRITRDTPQLIWQEDLQGNLTWANAAYLAMADRQIDEGEARCKVWPGARLFTEIQPPLPGDPRSYGGRYGLQLRGEQSEHWFDITAMPQDDAVVYFASDANATVRAERGQQEFLQTLAKTFAHLSTGLAIFNKRRQLTVFNPALLDMTGLPFTFLSARPSIDMVLDRLREMRKLPEPKNYLSWREQFSALEAAAKDGTYSERWNLIDGQTFRVTGRPHPDGAIAFLFEDISAEVSLTRRFRAEIETGQAVLNALPDAVAVFSSSSTLMMTNVGYDTMWQSENGGQFDVQDLRSALRIWKARSAPSPVWKEVEDFSRLRHLRPSLKSHIILHTGRQIEVEVTAISGGMTLIRFVAAVDAQATPSLQITASTKALAVGG